jgi:OmpA-OmpF porin, OOP family
MNRSELRTDQAWNSFDLWATWIIPGLLALTIALLAWRGFGSGTADCCKTEPAVATVAAPTPAVSAPPVVEPIPQAAPAVAPVASAPATPAVVAPPALPEPVVAATPIPVPAEPAPVIAAAPLPSTTAAPAVVVDCNKIMDGVAVAFEVNSARLSRSGQQALQQTIKCLKSGNYQVGGHTDSDGNPRSNAKLSLARARAATAYLISQGVPARKLRAIGYGQAQPIASNKTEQGKARNRRISFRPL